MNLSNDTVTLLNGQNLENKQNIVMTLHSITSSGYPHTCMVSVGEIIAINPQTLRIALWPETQTSLSLHEIGKANLVIVNNHKVTYLELDTKLLPKPEQETYVRTRFEAIVKSVKEDKAKYADIVSGITIALHKPEDILNRWKVTLNELLSV